MPETGVTVQEARRIAAEIGIDWDEEVFDLEAFRAAMLAVRSEDLEAEAPADDPVRLGLLARHRLRGGRHDRP